MSRRPSRPLFLQKAHYRRSRAIDAARALPIAGFILLLLPILWSGNESIGIMQTSLFLFGLWVALILGALFLSRILRDPTATPPRSQRPSDPEDPRP